MSQNNPKTAKPDIHKEITDQIIDLLDKVDINDYQSPFADLAAQGLPLNPTTEKHYQGINILALWFNQQAKAFSSNEWATFKQWKDKGAQVRKGEKGSRIIFYKPLIKSEANEKGDTEATVIPMLRQFTVFNACQVEGYEGHPKAEIPRQDVVTRNAVLDQFCTATGAAIRNEENRAFYNPKEDYINIPDTSLFIDTEKVSATEQYYSTVLHELTHWTGAKHRLDRFGSTGNIKRKEYAFEELIAELGSAFLCAQFNVQQTLPENHAIYIKSWLQDLKNDKTHIFKAAAQASKAFDYVQQLTQG